MASKTPTSEAVVHRKNAVQVPANVEKESVTPNGKASPFRSRRRKSSLGTPKASPGKVLDLTDDDVFSFG